MNRRLEMIAGMVRPGMVLADIGTDHAQLPICLVRAGKVPRAYACDVAPGPLSQACEHVAAAGLERQIQCILSNGLEKVPMDAECAVLAGMGFYTIRDILSASEQRLAGLKQILVQSNTDLMRLRGWLSSHRMTIVSEQMTEDRGHDYVAMEISPADHEPYSRLEQRCGPCLLQRSDEIFQRHCRAEIAHLEQLLEGKEAAECGHLREALADWKTAERRTAVHS
jgi:tRNA (adenine22-N1)-methyltransferase